MRSTSQRKIDNKVISTRFKKDTIKYIPAIVFPALINLVSMMIYTRIFVPEDYGIYNIIITTVILVSAFFSQWIMQSIQKYRPLYKENQKLNEFNSYTTMIIIASSFLILIISLPIFLSLDYYKPIKIDNFALLYWTTTFLIILQSLFNIGLVVYQSDLNVKKFRTFHLLNSFFKFLISIFFIFFVYMNVTSIFWGMIVSFLILLIPIYKKNNLLSISANFDKLEFKKFFLKVFNYGFPMFGWFLGNSLLGLIDRYMLGFYKGSYEVGIYSASYSLVSMGLGLICGPLLNAAHPVIMNNTNLGKFEIERVITNFSRIFLMIVLPLATLIIVFKEGIVNIILGDQYGEGAIIIPILVLGIIFWNFSMYGHKVHEITGKTNKMLLFVTLSVLINIILNMLLIPKYSYVGAAVGTLIGYLSYPIFILASARKVKWNIPWSTLIKVILSCLIASVVTMRFINFFKNTDDELFQILYMAAGTVLWLILYLIALTLFKEKIKL